MARRYGSEYEQRNEVARDQGFRNYADKRQQLERARDGELFQESYPFGGSARDPGYLRAVGLYNEAFYPKNGKKDYATGGALSQWFVEYAEMMTYEEWEDLYGEA